MAVEVITLHIMPVDPDVDLEKILHQTLDYLRKFTNKEDMESKHQIKPMAFGLQMLEIIFVRQEGQGSLENLSKDINAFEGVKSVDIADMRRAIG
ncbi:hypothetical protein GF342_02745 [Candidatus Woesearchaeota archaeon]|nr:hypothetical protein [Candidatus Woesearchaeota archaeon]